MGSHRGLAICAKGVVTSHCEVGECLFECSTGRVEVGLTDRVVRLPSTIRSAGADRLLRPRRT